MEHPIRRWRRWPIDVASPLNNPYAYTQVEISRLEWNTADVVNPHLLPPQMNVAMLYWRPLQDSPPSKVHHPLPYKMLLFDADGTLRRCTVPGQPCPNTSDEWELMPNVQEILSTHYAKKPMTIISNQGGIEAGFLSHDMAWSLLLECFTRIYPGRAYTAFFLCPHLSTRGCVCRKPSPFLLLKAVYEQWETISRAKCLYVGDMASDEEAAQRAGMPFLWAKDFFQWET